MVRGVKLFAILTVSLLLITGCGNNEKTLTCTNSEESSGIKMNQEVTMTFKDDSIDNEATDDTIINNWDMFASMLDSQFEQTNKDGVSLKTNNNKDKHTYNVSLEIDLTKASDDTLAEYDLDGIANETATYEDTKKSAEADGFTCK